jgi:hypothetical protein
LTGAVGPSVLRTRKLESLLEKNRPVAQYTSDGPIPRASRHPAERRKHYRFPMSVPATFRWERSEGGPSTGAGGTRDVSLHGAYIVSATCPPPDAVVEIEIRIPQLSSAPSVTMTARMRAQRVDHPPSGKRKGGFAVTGKGIVSHQFSRMGNVKESQR